MLLDGDQFNLKQKLVWMHNNSAFIEQVKI